MEIVLAALAKYGASIDTNGYISRGGKVLAVRPVIMRQRLRFELTSGQLLASGPIKEEFVHEFVKRYWYWSQ